MRVTLLISLKRVFRVMTRVVVDSQCEQQSVGSLEKCQHQFCLECIVQWSKTSNTCPVDRTAFTVIQQRRRIGEAVRKKIKVKLPKQLEYEVGLNQLPVFLPYQYEPHSDPESQFSHEPERESRLSQDASVWCRCGHCQCITNHPGFHSNCLNVYILQNIYNVYKSKYGRIHRRLREERYQFVAQCSIVSWCWGVFGSRIRVALPSCAVLRIQQEFPDPAGGSLTNLPLKADCYLLSKLKA
uniref:cullin-RING-type E3 NEDD8 transferase n=1 Tax=Knipowitschia caucasica TaxID=637954 RepID=A0AAV2LZF2_KNICA